MHLKETAVITFTRGLVLRVGDRQLEFERDLGDGRVQFKYLDNFEVATFRLAALYQDIVDGRFAPTTLPPATDQSTAQALPLPPAWTPRQQALISFRMAFVRAVLRTCVPGPVRAHCAVVVDQVWQRLTAEATAGGAQMLFRCPAPHTIERWVQTYLSADRNPYVLADRRAFRSRGKRLERRVEEIVDEFLAKHYLVLRGPTVKEIHGRIGRHISALNRQHGSALTAPAERTLNRRVLDIPHYIRDAKRVGRSFAKNKWRYSLKGDQSTRIMERIEVDHTLLDIWVLDPRSGMPLGRPWITLLIDRYSGYLLGFYISFYGPSSATVARAIKVSIMPKDDWVAAVPDAPNRWTAMGIGEQYVVDNGLEFHSQAFERIAWELRCDLLFNPVRQPWLKSAIERAMMETSRVLPAQGKVHRPIPNAVLPSPGEGAAITFDDLCTCLLEWASQKYPLHIHRKTLCRPLDLWEEGRAGMPPAMLPTQLSGLDLLCGLSAQRRVDGDGVFFNYLRYNSVELQDYRRSFGSSLRTEIRFNPDDLLQIHVHLPKAGSWLRVPLQRPTLPEGQGLSLIQLQILRREAGKKLTRANAEEALRQAAERLHDQWSHAVRHGRQLRRDSDFVRMQALTSVPFGPPTDQESTCSEPPLMVSPLMHETLPQVIPFDTFSLEEF